MKKCKHPHWCGDWDGMFITPLTPEYECCTCRCDGKMPIDYGNLDGHEQQLLDEWRSQFFEDVC